MTTLSGWMRKLTKENKAKPKKVQRPQKQLVAIAYSKIERAKAAKKK